MSAGMTLDEQAAALRRQGVSEAAIARWLNPNREEWKKAVSQPRYQDFPIRIVVPWSALCSDNQKYVPAHTKGGHQKLILTDAYREAKRKIRELAQQAMHGNVPCRMPLKLLAEVWVPDNRPHDIANFCKNAHDAMEGVVYANDAQLHDVHWINRGADVDQPRAIITLEPL